MRSGGIFILCVVGILIFYLVFFGPSKERYSVNHPILQKIRDNFAKMDPDYANIPLREGDSSYTENKSVITVCLKDPDTGKYYSMNTLMYVSIHELAHAVSSQHGHGEQFRDHFAKLLKRATELGFYNPALPIPNSYCGIDKHPPPEDD
jgi:hypothetical protein